MSASSAAPHSQEGWERIAERGSVWGMRFTVWCYRVLGRHVSLALVHAIVTYFYLTDRAGRRASLHYLQRVWANPEGRHQLPRAPGAWLCFLHYREFALAIADRTTVAAMSVVSKDVEEPGTTWGGAIPAELLRDWQRTLVNLRNLDSTIKKVKDLAKGSGM